MGRVEWTRAEGEDVEAVVAMFVNREQPHSARITPSRGDGGVDILDRAAEPGGRDAVYQVKKYTAPLTAKQKDEVEKSLGRLFEDPRWADLDVGTWYLVTPWDPTPEAENWLQGLAENRNLKAVWHGLTYVEQLAAKYPDIVDYYLHGGRSRVEHAFTAVSAYFSAGEAQDGIDVPTATARLDASLAVLDTDPHYRYEVRFGEGELPGLIDRPGLVMTWMSGNQATGRWRAVDIIARCRASTQVRPITVSGEFIAETGSEFAETLRDFHSFGTPFQSPPGTYRGEVDAPGGLGGRLERGTLRMLPHPQHLGDNPEMHLQVLSPGGSVLSAVNLTRVDRSSGNDGVRVVLEEEHHVFRIEDRYNLLQGNGNRTISFGDFAGESVTAVRSALDFLGQCRPPNVGRLSIRHTPPERGTIDPNLAFEWPSEMKVEFDSLTHTIESLSVLQQHSSSLIRVPDLATVSSSQVAEWHFVTTVLKGQEAVRQYPEGHCLIIELDAEAVVPEGTFAITLPLTVEVGTQHLELGNVEAWLADPVTIDHRTHEGRTYHWVTTPDRRVRYRLGDAVQADQ